MAIPQTFLQELLARADIVEIVATNTVPGPQGLERLTTVSVAPPSNCWMTCSARLPVYTLLIATFVPQAHWGPFSLQGLVMFSMYALGVLMALIVALVLHRLDFGRRKHFVDFLHLPHYRAPNWPELLRFVWTRVSSFLRKAGTIIFAMAVLLWALLSFPGGHSGHSELMQKLAAAQTEVTPAPVA